jgi:hypothetical protein
VTVTSVSSSTRSRCASASLMLMKTMSGGGADPSVPSSAEVTVAKTSHDSDRYDERTDNESVLCLLPVVAFDSPHLDPAHRGHTLYAVRLCNTRENDMGSGIELSTEEGSDIGLSNQGGLWHWTANPRGL